MSNTSLLWIVMAAQLLLILTWCLGSLRPETPLIFGFSCGVVAVLSDVLARQLNEASLGGSALAIAAGFGIAVLGQLGRGARRRNTTLALSQNCLGIIAVSSLSVVLVLARLPEGQELAQAAIPISLGGLLLSYLTLLIPFPPIHENIPRSRVGLGVALIAGLIAGALWIPHISDIPALVGALIGTLAAATAACVDLAAVFALRSRELRRLEATEPSEPDQTQILLQRDQADVVLPTRSVRISDVLLAPLLGVSAAVSVTYLLLPLA